MEKKSFFFMCKQFHFHDDVQHDGKMSEEISN